MAQGNRLQNTWLVLLIGAAALLLAGCATPGGYGAPYPSGGYGQSVPNQYGQQIVGTVESLDAYGDRIVLSVDQGGAGYGGRQLAVRYDQQTRLIYQGQAHPVEGLERGDVIRIDATQSGADWWARSIEVLRNVRESGGYGGGYGNAYEELRGTVGLVDTRYRTIRLDGAGYAGTTQVEYDHATVVEYQGRSYRPENLERGDLVRVQARRGNGGTWQAERITVERSARRY
ncbi:DUF5666 domain-containing protein [Luteimonas vadosa]|uniref:DUF5666 domain-containing protein n=1 Tax=Luteimonas vadosa TaxID=1165507 RepID=A0ABP9DUG6_9GAMM